MKFKNKPILGMIHCSGSNWGVVDDAIKEIQIYIDEGVDGIIVENYHGGISDVEFVLDKMVMKGLYKYLDVGVNVLPNEYEKAFFLAERYEGSFIQMDYIAGDYGSGVINEFDYFDIKEDGYEDIAVLGGVWPKYYTPVEGSVLEDDIKEGMNRATAIVVTGEGTGKETPLDKIKNFRNICGKHPLIIGAGLDASNVAEQLPFADGAIVGSCFKPFKRTQELIKRELVREFMDEVNKVR
jgi:predicted TIM-barrel enzyme